MITKERLPLARDGQGSSGYVPEASEIVKGVEIASRAESAEYLVDSFKGNIYKAGPAMIEASQGMFSSLEHNYENKLILENKNDQDKSNSFKGIKPESSKANEKALFASADLKAELQTQNIMELKIDYAISNSSELKLIVSTNDNPVNDKINKDFDDLMHDFYELNNVKIETTAEGSFLMSYDEKGNSIPVDSERVSELTSREFPTFLQKYGVKASLKRHHFPGEAAIAPSLYVPENEAVPPVSEPASATVSAKQKLEEGPTPT